MASYSEDSGFVKTVARKGRGNAPQAEFRVEWQRRSKQNKCVCMVILTQKRAEVHAFCKDFRPFV